MIMKRSETNICFGLLTICCQNNLKNMTKYSIINSTIQKFCEETGLLSELNNIFCIFDDVYRTKLSIGYKLKKTDKGIEITYGFA